MFSDRMLQAFSAVIVPSAFRMASSCTSTTLMCFSRNSDAAKSSSPGGVSRNKGRFPLITALLAAWITSCFGTNQMSPSKRLSIALSSSSRESHRFINPRNPVCSITALRILRCIAVMLSHSSLYTLANSSNERPMPLFFTAYRLMKSSTMPPISESGGGDSPCGLRATTSLRSSSAVRLKSWLTSNFMNTISTSLALLRYVSSRAWALKSSHASKKSINSSNDMEAS
mmetsp:Transcript_52589/g.87292  ORF Transcript_52589/g.87292 Transcript_52589/m.87292 type:complete len:228 (+) Transcript_52589:713-1396(+)